MDVLPFLDYRGIHHGCISLRIVPFERILTIYGSKNAGGALHDDGVIP